MDIYTFRFLISQKGNWPRPCCILGLLFFYSSFLSPHFPLRWVRPASLVFLPLRFSLVLPALDSRHPEDRGHVSFLPSIQYLVCRPACGQYAVYFIWGNEFRKLKSLYPPSTLRCSPIPHGSVLSSFWFSGNVTPPSYTASLPLFIFLFLQKEAAHCSSAASHTPSISKALLYAGFPLLCPLFLSISSAWQ